MREFHRHWSGWVVLLLAGCGGMLPPPPPPKMRTAPPVTTTSLPPQSPHGHKHDEAPPSTGKNRYQVKFETSKGDLVVEVHRDWAPLGADRFRKLVEEGYYDGCKFFRVMPNFIVQWGMNGDPALNKKYQENKIADDKRRQSNTRGTIVFATSGPDSRTSQLFINLADNAQSLDAQNFAPFGKVVQGMEDVVDQITSEYGEQPSQPAIANGGNTYLDERFPNLDYIIKATVLSPDEK